MPSANFKRNIKRIKAKLATDFEPAVASPTAGAVGTGKLFIAGQIFDGTIGGVTQVVNVGRPAAAQYAAKTGGSVVVSSGGGGGTTTGGTTVDLTSLYGAPYLTVAADTALTNERTLAVSSAFALTDGGSNSTLTLALTAPGTLAHDSTNVATGSHTHAITASDAPGAAASLLKSSAAGLLTLPQFTATTQVTTPTIDTASGDLALSPFTGITTGVQFTATTKLRTPLIDTASGDLSLTPATGITTGAQFTATTKVVTPLIDSTGDLTLSPDGFDVILDTSVNLVSSNYVTETAGFRLPSSGAADILSVTTNEMTSRQSIYGAGTAFRVLHHTHDYDHAHVVVNPGGSWNLDEQFGVDIDDNLLVRGYIVGKHAIQLPGAMMICHFDGAEPYETNYTGNPMGHMGQVGTEGGGVVYRPGKFGKAIQIAQSIANDVVNPSFELSTNAWGEWYGTGSMERSAVVALYGTYSLALTATAANYAWGTDPLSLPNGSSLTVSAYFLGAGSATLILYDLTSNTQRASDTDTSDAVTWKRLSASWTNTTGVAKNIRLGLEVDTAGATLYFDGVQAEQLPYATPYCDGSLGNGHSWTGTAHSSTSIRTAATLTYDASTTLSPLAMTIGCWVRRSGTSAGYIVAHPGMSIEFL
jgi:hypothetical protein